MADWRHSRYVGAEIKALSNLIKRQIDANQLFKDPNCPTGMQGMIVGYLCDRREEDVFQRDIEIAFDIRRSTATGILKLMERKNLITRVPVAHDERLKKLVLTPEAVALHEKIITHFAKIEAMLAKGLTQEELDTFFRITDLMKKNLSV